MAIYEIYKPALNLPFIEMSRAQARQYFDHFVGEIPRRIRMLEEQVRLDSGFEQWKADGSDVSVAGLWVWLKERARRQELTDADRQYLRDSNPGPLGEWLAQTYVNLSPETYSYCIDAGMYLGEVVRQRHPEVLWQIGPKPKRGVYYNRPVIATPDGLFIWDTLQTVLGNVQLFFIQDGRDRDLLTDLKDIEDRVRKRR